jgi:hypothetical protein
VKSTSWAGWQLPVQWPRAYRPAAAPAATTERVLKAQALLKAAILLALLSFTVFARFGLALSADYSVQAELLALYTLVGVMALTGAAELNTRGALGYIAIVSVAAASFLVNASLGAHESSVGSILLLTILYAPLAISLREDLVQPSLWHWVMKTFLRIALFIALAGIAQFFAQFVYSPEWLFDFRPLIPDAIRGSGDYHTVQATRHWLMKSNGFFLREPTSFSFLMALALLCELSLTRRKWVMAIFGAGILLSYSGSGVVALAVGMIFPPGRRSLVHLAAAVGLGALALLLLGDVLNLSYTVDRVNEVQNEKSSAYARFVDPAVALFHYMGSDVWTPVLGHGPGTLPRLTDAYESTFAKLPFEYGLLGALAFGMLILGAINRAGTPIRIRIALGIAWVLLGSALLSPSHLLVIYILCAMWPRAIAARAAMDSRT